MVHGILRISFLYLAGVLAGACYPKGGTVPIPSSRSLSPARGRSHRVWWGCWVLLAATLQCQHHLARGWGAMQAVIN